MNKDGLTQVKERFSRLEAAVDVLLSACPLDKKESAWLDILQYLGTMYSKLEQASKSSTISKAWFDTKKHERKTDELLAYLHHARNAVEHTIVKASGQATFAVSARIGEAGGVFGISLDKNGQPFASGVGVTDIAVHEQEIMLHAAIDRGVTYKPPTTHMSKPIQGLTAKDVAPLIMQYALRIVDEAELLVK